MSRAVLVLLFLSLQAQASFPRDYLTQKFDSKESCLKHTVEVAEVIETGSKHKYKVLETFCRKYKAPKDKFFYRGLVRYLTDSIRKVEGRSKNFSALQSCQGYGEDFSARLKELGFTVVEKYCEKRDKNYNSYVSYFTMEKKTFSHLPLKKKYLSLSLCEEELASIIEDFNTTEFSPLLSHCRLIKSYDGKKDYYTSSLEYVRPFSHSVYLVETKTFNNSGECQNISDNLIGKFGQAEFPIISNYCTSSAGQYQRVILFKDKVGFSRLDMYATYPLDSLNACLNQVEKIKGQFKKIKREIVYGYCNQTKKGFRGFIHYRQIL